MSRLLTAFCRYKIMSCDFGFGRVCLIMYVSNSMRY